MFLDPASGAAASPEVLEATSDQAWLEAMLTVERAMAVAAGRAGLAPAAAVEAVAGVCDPAGFDVDSLARGYAGSATPVPALVDRLREILPPSAHAAVHPAATSQDVVDTAMMLVIRSAGTAILAQTEAVTGELARLSRTHRDTPLMGRTLGQPAAVTTLGFALAARLAGIDAAAATLSEVIDSRLAVQYGGAVGTLAAVPDKAGEAGEAGPVLVAELAAELGLGVPVVSWHTSRGRVAAVACGLGVLAGELAGLAQDVVLLAGSGAVGAARPGGSSAMPHKRNPASAVLAVAAAHRVPGLVSTVLAGMPQELQRSAGRWQAEPAVITDLLRCVGATARQTAEALTGLEVHAEAMAAEIAVLTSRTGTDPGPGPAGSWVDRVLDSRGAPR